jgi:hypothetical protein
VRFPPAPRRAAIPWAAGLGLLALAALVPGCASPGPPAPPKEAMARPEWRVGDRWLFRRTPGQGPSIMVTHEVTEARADGYTMRISSSSQDLTRHWTPALEVAGHTVQGRALNRFEPAARYFDWPLALGKAWSQDFEYRDGRADGRYENRWRVAKEPAMVDVAAGLFLTLKIERLGGDGQRLEAYWYAPAVRYWVRLQDDLGRYTEELVEFRLAP